MKYLATVDNNFEVEMLRELLKKNGITLSAKHRETGEYMLIAAGTTIFGEDLYVSDEQYDEAHALFEAFFAGNAPIDEKELENQALNAPNPEPLFYDEDNSADDSTVDDSNTDDDSSK